MPNLHLVNGASTGNLIFTYIFLFTAFVTQASFFALCAAIISLLMTALIPRRGFTFTIAIILASVLIAVQIADLIVYSLYHSHEVAIGVEVLRRGALMQVLPLSLKEGGLLIGILVIAFMIQWGIAQVIWGRITKNNPGRGGIIASALIVASFLFSYGMMAGVLSVPRDYQLNDDTSLMLLKASRFVPYFPDVFKAIMPVTDRYERVTNTNSGPLTYQTQPPAHPLNYPLKPMQCGPQRSLPNILFLVVDTWRFDAMTKNITPNIYRFSKRTTQFMQHWSGGNCTRTGIFSLFYGIPANYWDSTVRYKRAPILMDELRENNYEMVIYGSATIKFPTFDRNVFLNVKNLRTNTPGKTTVDRDRQITKDFIQFLKDRDLSHPFFGFLFYDAPHNYCGGGKKTHQGPFKPAVKYCARFALTKYSDRVPYVNRYNNSVYSVDQDMGEIFATLKQEDLYRNTIIIVTADHGEQINDEKLGYWSHNSAYSPYQLHIPMLVYWPSRAPRLVEYKTTHYDVVPTLLKRVFDCQNPTKDYSIGESLFIPKYPTYTLSSNYTSYAILTKNRAVMFYPNGAYAITTPMAEQMPYAKLDVDIVKQANEVLNRYYQ